MEARDKLIHVLEDSMTTIWPTATWVYPTTSNNLTTENADDSNGPPLSEFIGIMVGLFGIVGLLANLVVILVLVLSRSRALSSYRYLIVHLATTDLISSIFQLLYARLELNQHVWVFADWSCKLIYPVMTIATNLATGTILVIAMERYLGVIKPHRSRWKKRHVVYALAGVWIWSIGIVIPNIIQIKIYMSGGDKNCGEIWGSDTLRSIYGISFFFLAFLIPLASITFIHTRIICRLKNPDIRPDRASKSQRRDEKRIARVLTAIVIAFAVCVSPNKLMFFIYDVAPSAFVPEVHYYLRLIQVLHYARAMIDPLLYCVVDKRFKRDLGNALKAARGQSFLDSIDWRSRSRSPSTRKQSSHGESSSMHSSPRTPRASFARTISKDSMSRGLSVDSLNSTGSNVSDVKRSPRSQRADKNLMLTAAKNRWERSRTMSQNSMVRTRSLRSDTKSSIENLSRRGKMFSTSDLPESPSTEDILTTKWNYTRTSMKYARSITNADDMDDVFLDSSDEGNADLLASEDRIPCPGRTTEI